MSKVSEGELKIALKRLLKRYHGALAAVIFVIGISLRLISINYSSVVWRIIGDFGTFLAAAVAIPFIYERFIRAEDRQVFLSDLKDVLETKLANSQNVYPRFYEFGRLPLNQKVSFLQCAKREVIEVGIALRTLVGK